MRAPTDEAIRFLIQRADDGEEERQMACIPIPDGEEHFYALYLEGNRFTHAGNMDDFFLLLLG